MRPKAQKIEATLAEPYDRRGATGEIVPGRVELALEEELSGQILGGRRAGRLQNLSITLGPAQIWASRNIARIKSIPSQSFIRPWLAAGIRRELHLTVA